MWLWVSCSLKNVLAAGELRLESSPMYLCVPISYMKIEGTWQIRCWMYI